jgi:hypothetical protein
MDATGSWNAFTENVKVGYIRGHYVICRTSFTYQARQLSTSDQIWLPEHFHSSYLSYFCFNSTPQLDKMQLELDTGFLVVDFQFPASIPPFSLTFFVHLLILIPKLTGLSSRLQTRLNSLPSRELSNKRILLSRPSYLSVEELQMRRPSLEWQAKPVHANHLLTLQSI